MDWLYLLAVQGILKSLLQHHISKASVLHHLSFDGSVAALMAKEGFDPVYGARPLRRAIVRLVEDAFSGAMLEGRVKAGDTVRAAVKDGAVTFEKDERPAPEAETAPVDEEAAGEKTE